VELKGQGKIKSVCKAINPPWDFKSLERPTTPEEIQEQREEKGAVIKTEGFGNKST